MQGLLGPFVALCSVLAFDAVLKLWIGPAELLSNAIKSLCLYLANKRSSLQAMEIGVQLNLVCSRIDEILPVLSDQLASISAPLESAVQPWTQFVDCFAPCVSAAETARAARQDSQKAQVGT